MFFYMFFLRLRSELKCSLPPFHKIFAFKQLVGRQGLWSRFTLYVVLVKITFFNGLIQLHGTSCSKDIKKKFPLLLSITARRSLD